MQQTQVVDTDPTINTPVGTLDKLCIVVPRGENAGLEAEHTTVVATPHESKDDLPQRVEHIENGGGVIAYAGQDAVGANMFIGGRINGMLVAADGASFGERDNTAKAAQFIVKSMLGLGTRMAKNEGSINNPNQITTTMSNMFKGLTEAIPIQFPKGASTAIAAAIHMEDGKQHLSYSSVGDCQIILVSRDQLGNIVNIDRFPIPHDIIDDKYRPSLKSDSLEETQQLHKNLAKPLLEGSLKEMASAVSSYIGQEREDLQVRDGRINITKEMAKISAEMNKPVTSVDIAVVSDNVGDKLPDDVFRSLFAPQGFSTPSGTELSQKLATEMRKRDDDDGCMAFMRMKVRPYKTQTATT